MAEAPGLDCLNPPPPPPLGPLPVRTKPFSGWCALADNFQKFYFFSKICATSVTLFRGFLSIQQPIHRGQMSIIIADPLVW